MKPAFFAPAGTLDKKPPHGQPCNSCGLCCVATLCPLGRFIFGRELGPCPALEYVGDRSQCGLVVHPMKHAMTKVLEHGPTKMSTAAVVLIGSGLGCDARFNGEPADQDFYSRLREHDRKNRATANRAKATWGLR